MKKIYTIISLMFLTWFFIASLTSYSQCSVAITANPPSATVCSPQTVTLTATPGAMGTPPYAYLWSTAATTQSITVNATGTYSVTITDVLLCTSSGSKLITVNLSPTPTVTGKACVCMNLAGVIYSTPFVSGHTWTWTVTGGSITGGQNTNQIIVTWGAAGSGSVAVRETITATGCYNDAALNITISSTFPP
ncbi:MAG: hypothetical protein NT004_12905 [Bacteroidetes bacterium]|nr:hypothetical protein [Bacteroidota bacterium]